MTEYATPAPVTSQARSGLFRRMLRNPVAVASLAFLALVAFVAIFGSAIAPYDPNLSSLKLILAPPSPQHLLGGDSAGRDIFSRLLVATQISIGAALLATVVALVIGVTAGLIAGYYGGAFDSVASWVTSLVMAMPAVIVLLAARAIIGPSVWLAMAIFGALLSPAFYRLVQSSVVSVRNELYVDAARVSGLSDARIIGRHIFSVVRAPIIIQCAIVIGIALGIQSGLEFIGLGDLSVPTWGSMLNDGFANIFRAPILMLWPSLAIALTSMALVLVANVARDELERAGTKRKKVRGRKATVGHAMSTDAAPTEPLPDGTLLAIRDIVVGYDQPKGTVIEVVHGIDLTIRRGEILGLVGESGSGKTQTAFSVLGLLPEGGRVVSGSIVFENVSLAGAPESVFRTVRGGRIGYIPQEPMSNLDPSFTIGSQLVEPMRVVLKLSRAEAKKRAMDLLARVGIPDPARTFAAYPHEVSGGMAQRVLIAGAVSCDPELLIADEPTTALDVTVQAEVLDLIRDLQRELNLGVLLVTHNFGVVADLCDRVSVMQAGRIVESGTAASIFANPQHPYTQSLLDSILEDGPARSPLVSITAEDAS
ncbi:dipeptide/oligopeptide/nickel ABC transporter permease/ATP-binding protein [Subtercola frigoramans]|uniref:ABC-type dipeptide/oligopeptide/nickel transport system ATPase component/ABC-type dipeptide/oligopeptide/nickel transport system permease subunit n=1 Tax=Subtercola frigoramans TaxID=120298 RepID=A0ABS2L9C4_9MICO|nr:dipeptide/oligopeptide/nickel ABC transporter permease/ATP-binding protein [Subtercola frigoramans]MBM7473703.1 ABC-type dipeptide/oligopeptide/nickel transport system ATPase component/ABC-type dipeptide/oligopeptide/nickel transport system permease subunit [Subtercola frigoramans]